MGDAWTVEALINGIVQKVDIKETNIIGKSQSKKKIVIEQIAEMKKKAWRTYQKESSTYTEKHKQSVWVKTTARITGERDGTHWTVVVYKKEVIAKNGGDILETLYFYKNDKSKKIISKSETGLMQ